MLKSLKGRVRVGSSQLVPNGLKRVGSLADLQICKSTIPAQSQLGYLHKSQPTPP